MSITEDRSARVLDRPGNPPPPAWGSPQERRLVRWGLVGFFLLAAYAVVFVTLGTLVWT